MTFLAKYLKLHLPKLGILLLLLSFGVLAGFSTVLHAHELDFSSTHDDCAPCHWSQSHQTGETDTTGIEAPTVFRSFQLIPAESIDKLFVNKLSNRGPPPLS
jgi:hypothetical protein